MNIIPVCIGCFDSAPHLANICFAVSLLVVGIIGGKRLRKHESEDAST